MSDNARRNRMFVSLLLALGMLGACLSGAAADDPIKLLADVPYKPDAASQYERQRCKLDLYLPAGKKQFATLVWFHGGGLTAGHKGDDIAIAAAERFAREGIAVASVNYRLSPQAKFPAYVDDAAAAVVFVLREIEAHGGAPRRVFVSGHSAGGYLTAMIGLDPQYLAKHGAKPTDVAGYLPVAGQMITHSTVRQEQGIAKTRPVIDAGAPAYHVSKSAPPFICYVGSNDLPMRPEENRLFVAAMKAAGHADVQYVEVQGRDHGTIASMLGDPNDVVAASMKEFMARLSK